MTELPRTAAMLDLLNEGTILGPELAPDTEFTAIISDSRQTVPGALFVAVKGGVRDGAEFIQYALRMEARAVVASLEGAITALETMGGTCPVPLIVVDDPRATLSRMAAGFHGAQPATVAAITGTSGKTSVADFLRQLWTALGREAASLGTLGIASPSITIAGGLTTPDPLALHAALAKLAASGVDRLAMEASSHGLDQRRLEGVAVSAVALTNIARDHMDYHPTSAHYAAAKLRLFAELAPEGTPVVANSDDAIYPLLAQIARARGMRLIPVGTGDAAEDGLRIHSTQFTETGQIISVGWQGKRHEIELPLIGTFQARNVLTAAGLAIGCGEDAEAVLAALPALEGVHGRMELVARRASGAPVYVDYAHKPDAIAAALTGLRPHVKGRLHIVFGAGGDRDPGKRELMGAAAAEHADVVIITDDNPRSEDPAKIRAAIRSAAPEATEIADRAEAIISAIDNLEPQDALLIAGKGHETGQIVAGDVIPFDDAEQARVAVLALDGDEEDLSGFLKDLL